MQIIELSSKMSSVAQLLRKERKTTGFVPTMGALHKGHLSLVEEAKKQCDIVIVSIFVNPTQFNDKNDLKNYPRDTKKDIELLKEVGCELLFLPDVKQIYPEPDNRTYDFGNLDKVMEGYYRPGHFNGVAQVVSRLFDIVKPDKAFFGEKDYQQLAIIREMTRKLNYDIEIVGVPTIREDDGLAMSSRNMLLTKEQRKKSTVIARTLFESYNFAKSKSIEETINFVVEKIDNVSGFNTEYFEIVDGDTLQRVNSWDQSGYIAGCIAVYAGDIRLIDNVIYKKEMS
ncbi:pantoate--beta-alanine ligase [Marinilabiliaceae bacterium ANBcel2]|nr:pantoate--beta-alanine ligase [Marinilabiliaceae bacterium ANBcel2]